MAGKLINTLKYGSSRTKRKIYLLFGVLAVGVVLTTAALIVGNAMLGLLAFTVIFVDGLILFNTSFESRTVEVSEKKDQVNVKIYIVVKNGKNISETADMVFEAVERDFETLRLKKPKAINVMVRGIAGVMNGVIVKRNIDIVRNNN